MIEPGTLKILHTAGSAALKAYQRRRAEEARHALLRALSKGKTWVISEDQAAAALFAYMRAAEEGAARVNLDMIAEAFANAAQEPTFAPNEFRRHVRMLSDLSRDEIIVIAELIKVTKECDGLTIPEVRLFIRSEMANRLSGPGKFFNSPEDIIQHLTALQRTGLLILESGYGGSYFHPTGLLIQVERLVNFDRAASDDGG